MKKMPTIEELMSPFPYTISVTETVKEAKLYMYENSIRHLPVVDEGKLVGIITDRDLKLAQAVSGDDKFDQKYVVGDLCLYDVYVVPASTGAYEVLSTMAKNRIGSALITEEDELVGIFTGTDACRSFSEFMMNECVAD